MTKYDDQIRYCVKRLENSLTSVAWRIANKVFEEEKKRLIKELMNVGSKRNKLTKNKADSNKEKVIPKILQTEKFVNSKKGTWDRGGGPYRIIGPGKEAGTFELEHIATGKRINTVFKTLASRWKHIL